MQQIEYKLLIEENVVAISEYRYEANIYVVGLLLLTILKLHVSIRFLSEIFFMTYST